MLFAGFLQLILIFLTSSSGAVSAANGKPDSAKADEVQLPACRACRIFVESFKKGLERTAKGKFEGGDTAWEEKNLGSYAHSEVRFIEIQENLCSELYEGKNQCYQLIEKYEEALETWWFKKQNEEPDLLQYLCIDTFKVCCPDLHYGPNCTPCQGFPDNVCHKNGKCKGTGTRKGNGKCSCNLGYAGDYCDLCADGHYETYRDAQQVICAACHHSCDLKCSSAGPTGCDKCKPGYSEYKDKGCTDINECLLGKSTCKSSQLCINTEGSYQCLNCHPSCLTCTGDGPDECTSCAEGYKKKDNSCVNVAEEEKKSYISMTRYLTYIGLCISTCIIFQKNVSIAAILGICIALYISLSEYMSSNPEMDNLKDQLSEQLKRAFGTD